MLATENRHVNREFFPNIECVISLCFMLPLSSYPSWSTLKSRLFYSYLGNQKKKKKILLSLQQWVLLVFGFLAGLLAAASTLGLLTSMVKAIINKGQGILQCKNSTGVVNSSSVTYECPFDPTRVYVSCMQKFVVSSLKLTWIDAKKIPLLISYVLSSFCWPGNHSHSVGASHPCVRGGNGVLLPLLCRLHFIPLPLPVPEEADAG